MENLDAANALATSPTRHALSVLREWFRTRRKTVAIAAAVALIGGGIALNWGWLVAAGVAPVMLALLPCAAMCALGLCANKPGASDSCEHGQKRATPPNAGSE